MSPLPATWRSFLPWALWSPPRSRASRTIPAMPVPMGPLVPGRSQELAGTDSGRCGKPPRRRIDGIPAVVHPVARHQRRRSERTSGEGRSRNPRGAFSAGRGALSSRSERAAAEAVVEGPNGATGVCPECTVVKSGSAMPPGGVHHPEVEAFHRGAPRSWPGLQGRRSRWYFGGTALLERVSG
jgi:hypothetical protein